MDSLRDQALLSVTVLAMVEETRQSWVSKVPYRLHRPDLTFVVDGKKGTFLEVVHALSMQLYQDFIQNFFLGRGGEGRGGFCMYGVHTHTF